jgi:hypothetical protein
MRRFSKSGLWLSLLVVAYSVQAQVDTSIVAQYHCNEGQDSLLHDSGPFGNHIALHNVSWAAGISGSGLVFNGTNSFGSVTSPVGTSLDFGTGDFSVGLWINTTSPSNSGHKENILSKGNPFNTGVTLSIEHGITYACVGSTGLAGYSLSVKPTNDGAWHYYVCVRKNGIVSIFNDTTLVQSYTCQQNVTVASTLFLGCHGTNGGELYNGKLDEITLYKKALSASGIVANYLSAKGQNSPLLIHIISPTDNRQPQFTWHPVPSVTSYTINIDTTRQFLSPIIHVPVSDTVFVPLTPLPLDTLYWFVSCNDSLGRHSIVDSVVIVPKDSFPTTLIPVSPDPTIERRPRLTWHPVVKAQQYALSVADNAGFVLPVVSIQVSDTSFLPLSDLPLGTIFWKVKSDVSLRFSNTSSFTIQSDSIPLLYRFNGASVKETKPRFAWRPVSSAVSYTIQIDTVFGFSDPLYIMPTVDTSFAPLIDLVPGTEYYWRVSSSRNAGLFSLTDTVRIDKANNVVSKNGMKNASSALVRTIGRNNRNFIVVQTSGVSRSVLVTMLSVSGKILFTKESANTNIVDVPLQTRMMSGIYIIRVLVDGKPFTSIVFVNK